MAALSNTPTNTPTNAPTNAQVNAHLNLAHKMDTAWKLLSGEIKPLSIDVLPKWEPQPLRLHDAKTGQAMPFSENWACEYWALVDDNGDVLKMISNPHKLPSKVYRNLTPRDFVSAAMSKAADLYKGVGEVCILSISFSDTSTQLLVTLKCPETFGLASNDADKFGTTLVLRNSYKQESGMQVAAGAVRFVCTNGCIWGDHTTIGWNHRDAEDAIEQKVSEVLDTHVEKARNYMDALEAVVMPKLHFASGFDKEWCTRRTFQDMEDRFTMAVAQLPVTWCQQKLVLQEAYRMQREKDTPLTKYDFWNACTGVASHQLKERNKHKASINSLNTIHTRRDTMGREINKAFVQNGIVDQVLAWNDAKFEDEKAKWIQSGWSKNYWTFVGPVFEPSKKKKRNITDIDDASFDASSDASSDGAPGAPQSSALDSDDDME